MRVYVIVRDGDIFMLKRGRYREGDNTLVVKMGFLSLFGRRVKFLVNPAHLVRFRKRNLIYGAFLVDMNARASIPASVEYDLDEEPNGVPPHALEILTEKSWWEAFMARARVTLGQLIIYLLAGAFLGYIFRILLFILFGVML